MHRAGYISHTAVSGRELHDLRIFKKGLTPEEVQILYTNTGIAPPAPAPNLQELLAAKSGGYRYGFNGQEHENEITGSQTHCSAEFWMYDARLGRRWEMDPVDKPWQSRYHAFSNKPITNIDPNGGNDDWFQNDDGQIIWDDSQSSSITKDGKSYSNIGTTLDLTVNSYIHEKNDIPVPGVDGDKLTTTYSIIGVYDKTGKFSRFETTVDVGIGKTFGVISGEDPTGSYQSMKKQGDGSWQGKFEYHTKVHDIEKIPLWLLGDIVDVNQKVQIQVANTGELSVSIGHGTFPSLDVSANGQYEYRFHQHSYQLSHGSSGTTSPGALIDAARSLKLNQQYIKSNNPSFYFSGYTAGTNYLQDYNYLPKNPK